MTGFFHIYYLTFRNLNVSISAPMLYDLIIFLIPIIIIGWGVFVLSRNEYRIRKRKRFLIKEMRHCLRTRESIYGSELINHCRTILHNIDLHSDMCSMFKTSYTYGSTEIGVNWYPVNGQFEFILVNKFEPIARIYYPGT